MRPILLFTLLLFSSDLWAQNWNIVDTTVGNSNATDSVWRSGPVLISEYLRNPVDNKLGVVTRYDSVQNKGLSVLLNEPDDWYNGDGDSTRVGLAKYSNANFTSILANNYANFQTDTVFTDVHNSTAEFNYLRGMPDHYGFRDGGELGRAATLRLSGSFGNNGRPYHNDNFDLLNLRFFTSQTEDNQASIDNFYAVRMEDFRGVNLNMIEKGWGIYMKPVILNNFFGGKVGIGTETVSHPLTIEAVANPLKITGIQPANDKEILTTNDDGEIHKISLQAMNQNFVIVNDNTTLSDEYYVYIHNGGDAIYTLPDPAIRTGMTWKIVNTGSGIITFSQPYYEGSEVRNQLLNKAGHYSIELFSDGSRYIAIK
ncbi:hypothetical protein [Jiulongibacter sediminis]|jgi:hypothetical protein|uniref:hypothetical protein n=1 Tax=Jiulongibacter sediminis TaxID=1605367 RepID=UPI0026ED00D9|nr:hypothetical protein [Jiulongibacter sediminis]